MAGARFGALTVIDRRGSIRGRAAWLCRCDCGAEVVREGPQLRRFTAAGKLQSCGCLKIERTAAMGVANKTHGFSKRGKLYHVWTQMMRRCYSPGSKDYPGYGGRGIAVCDEWRDVAAFFAWAHGAGYREGLTIDRINNGGPYSPRNCRFIENKFQGKNTRRVRFLTINGVVMSVSDWSRRSGIKYRTILQRLNMGWPAERAVMEPLCS